MHTHEIELHFGGDDPHFTLTGVSPSCVTELSNTAHKLAKEAFADFVTFGPVIARREDGSPDYGPKKKD